MKLVAQSDRLPYWITEIDTGFRVPYAKNTDKNQRGKPRKKYVVFPVVKVKTGPHFWKS